MAIFADREYILIEKLSCFMPLRKSLATLIENSIELKYTLPCTINGNEISRTCISTRDDYYFRSKGKSQNRDVAAIIYNGIVEYAYHDNEIDIRKLDILQTRALLSKLKFDGSATKSTQLKYGFQGEVMLHLILTHFFHAEKALARGYLYSALENSETKGYDSYLMVENDATIYLLFGEAKFYINGYKNSLESIFSNLDKVLSDSYFNRNFIAMENHYDHICESSKIRMVIDRWREDPTVNIAQEAEEHNMHLVYPMLVIFDDKMGSLDALIREIIEYVRDSCIDRSFNMSIEYTLYFLFLHVDNSRAIKEQVLTWISNNQQLMS
jgi:hypothetical protein